jgi:hypothetical protein
MTRAATPLWLALGAMAAITVRAPAAGAMTPLERDRSELAVRADTIVVGQCVQARAAWNAEQTVITTEAIYRVETRVSGDVPEGSPAVVWVPGGTVGTITQAVVGGPMPQAGERALLFLRRGTGINRFRLVTLVHGRWLVVQRDGAPMVLLPPGVPPLAVPQPSQPPAGSTPPPPVTAEPLDAVLDHLRTLTTSVDAAE